VLGKHSGRNAFHQHVRDRLGVTLAQDALERAFARFKSIADERKVVSADELHHVVIAACQPEVTIRV